MIQPIMLPRSTDWPERLRCRYTRHAQLDRIFGRKRHRLKVCYSKQPRPGFLEFRDLFPRYLVPFVAPAVKLASPFLHACLHKTLDGSGWWLGRGSPTRRCQSLHRGLPGSGGLDFEPAIAKTAGPRPVTSRAILWRY